MMNNNFTDNIALRGSYTHEERAISWSDAVLKIINSSKPNDDCLFHPHLHLAYTG